MKYEVGLIYGLEPTINLKLEEAQNEGWEIAGDIQVKHDTSRGINWLYVPLKRRINNDEVPERITVVSEISK